MLTLRSTALTAFFLLVPAAFAQVEQEAAPARPKSLVIMIADGFGPASLTMARNASPTPLTLDGMLVGNCGTRASNSFVTDSAAGATAYACGERTNNGMVATAPDKRPLGTILEAAERRGMATGLVTTTTIAHATPACFSAHVPTRAMTHLIADQQLRQGIEVLFGGGTTDFLPVDSGGKRTDGRDLFAVAAAGGYHVVRDRAGFDAAHETPVLGLFKPGHMSFEIDRDPALEPSIAEMTARALELLAGDPDGFLLVVEGGRIDHAAHANDAAGHLRDIYAYDDAVRAAVEFARSRGDTLVVSTSDHETGGMSLGRNLASVAQYAWKPEVLRAVHASTPVLAGKLLTAEDWRAELDTWAGITDPTQAEVDQIEAALAQPERIRRTELTKAVRDVINDRALVGWTSGGHTAVDVHVFAAGPGAEALRGHHENFEVGRILARLMGLEYAPPTVTLAAER